MLNEKFVPPKKMENHVAIGVELNFSKFYRLIGL